MNRCKRDGCNTEISDKATWCGDACRKAASRTTTPDNPDTMSDFNPDKSDKCQPGQVTPDMAYTIPGQVATRTNPDLINHGQPLSPHGLKKAGLKANRVAIPGDHDYAGVCVEVDGKWQVRP